MNDNIKIMSFDIEISDIFDLQIHEEIERYAPFHISVAATSILQGDERIWFSKNNEGIPLLNLSQNRAHELLQYLAELQNNGFMVCAWNGLNFDLRWIGYQANDMPFAARIALKSYDPMFQFFNQTGFPVSLGKVAEGMGIQQKKLMDGADAPRQWHAGNYQSVMEYCLGDCQLTNLIVCEILKTKQVRWVTNRGHINTKPMSRLKTVVEVIQDPDPDQSWMDTPIPKAKFFNWIEDAKKY